MIKHYSAKVLNGSVTDRLEVTAPWDGSLVGSVDVVGGDVMQSALQSAYALYQDRSQWLSAQHRIEILDKAKRIVLDRVEELALQVSKESGKPLVDSRIELIRAADGLQSCIDCIRTHHGEEIPMGISASSVNRIAFTTYEPIGTVMAYSAFNHPFNLIVHQVAPAVAAGCPVIVKPAHKAPLSCFAFVEILYEAGLPEGYCRSLVVDLDVAQQTVADERIGFFSFIGSGKVGWMLRSRLSPGTRCALEHSGVAPVIIAEDADLDGCLPLIARGGFYHAGQVCVSVQRVFAHESIVRQVAERLASQADAMIIGDPTSADTDVGPLIRHSEVQRVGNWVDEAVANGAELICGGKAMSDSCYHCTVLLNPADDATISRHEVFGPVICVYSYTEIDDAIRRANNVPFSFQAAVLSRNVDTAMYCFRRLNAAAVFINDHTAFRVDWMPFAGHKTSGYGTGGIAYTYEDMQARKLFVLRSGSL